MVKLTEWEIARLREASRAGGTPSAYGGVRAAVKDGMSIGEQRLEQAGLLDARARRLYITAAGREALGAIDEPKCVTCGHAWSFHPGSRSCVARYSPPADDPGLISCECREFVRPPAP